MTKEAEIKTVDDMVRYIEEKYDRQGRYLVDGTPRYAAAAVKFEDKYGAKGIAGRYKFVDGKEACFAEYGYRKRFMKYFHATRMQESKNPLAQEAARIILGNSSEALKAMNEEIKKLQTLNPELNRLNYNPHKILETYQALIGITSQYNPDDINYFLHSLRTGKRDEKLEERKDKLGITLGWQPAASTMDKIENHLNSRTAKKTYSAAVLKAARTASR